MNVEYGLRNNAYTVTAQMPTPDFIQTTIVLSRFRSFTARSRSRTAVLRRPLLGLRIYPSTQPPRSSRQGRFLCGLGRTARHPSVDAFVDSAENMRMNALAVVGCNYVQVIEGLLDSSHLSVLHSSALKRITG